MAIKSQVAKIKNNPIGGLIGAVAGYFVATKAIKTEKLWVKIVSVVIGGVAGAMAQSAIKAKISTPTAAEVKK